jgi:hypothetical protein
MCERHCLSQMAQITQTNTTSCIISQRKTDCLRLRLFCRFGVCLRKSARSAGGIGVSFVRIDRVLLCDYFPADYADHADEYNKLYYFAEKDKLELVWFWGWSFVCVNLRETLGFSLCKLLGYSYVVILPQIAQITQRNTTSCIISQRKTDCLRFRLFCRFGVCLRLSAGDIGV